MTSEQKEKLKQLVQTCYANAYRFGAIETQEARDTALDSLVEVGKYIDRIQVNQESRGE